MVEDTKKADVLQALANGSSDEDVMSSFGLTADELAEIKGSEAGDASGDVPAQPAEGDAPTGDAPEAGADAPAGEGEATA